jgi:PST family polysaccharide transporter
MSVVPAAVHGVAWNMIFGVGSRLLTLVSTLVLTRFIAPEAYGAVLAASISTTTVGVLTSFAFGQYLIARRATPDVSFQAAAVHTGIGVVAMALLVGFRVPLGELLETPAMAPFVAYYAVAHVLDRIRYVPERLLMRDLRFRAIATFNGLGELVFAVVALALAPRVGERAIVAAVLVRAMLVSALFIAAVPRRQWLVVTPLRRDVLRELFGYGLPITVAAVADRAATRWDNLIVSALFGPGAMGQYNLAYSLAETPISHVAEHIGEVLMPSFAKMTAADRPRAVVKAAAMMAIVVSPLGVGLGAIAPTLVETLFDARWSGMAPMLVVLSVMTVFRPMTWSAVAYLQAMQRTRLIMYASFARAVLVLALVGLFGALGGVTWACVGGAVGYAAHAVGIIVATGRATGMATRAYLAGVIRPLVACVPMFAAVTAVAMAIDATGGHSLASLIGQVLTGAVVYVISAVAVARADMLALWRLGLGVVRRGARPPTGVAPDSAASPG